MENLFVLPLHIPKGIFIRNVSTAINNILKYVFILKLYLI